MTKPFEFRAEDFLGVSLQENDLSTSQFGPSEKQAARIAEQANAKVQEWLKDSEMNYHQLAYRYKKAVTPIPKVRRLCVVCKKQEVKEPGKCGGCK